MSNSDITIKQVCVIGAGVMGSGIAAQIANAGIAVSLLDIIPEGASNRNIIAENAIQTLLKARPAPLMHKRYAKNIKVGNLEDNLDEIAQADWIIEVVTERIEIKLELYKKIDAARKKGSIVSSNTSTLPLFELTKGMPKTFCEDFLITHFFNPPRYMRLIEVIQGPQTRHNITSTLEEFCDIKLGKSIVECNDTPGFIANRIGIYWLQTGLQEAIRFGLTVEEADAIGGRPMGIPKTGVFGLMDLVGIDLMPHVLKSMLEYLPADDAYHQQEEIPELINTMIADGYTGRKGKGGFYRLNKSTSKKIKESIDLITGDYAISDKAKLASLNPAISKDLQKLLCFDDKGGHFAWAVLSKVLCYSASLVGQVSDSIYAIDQAMKLGYNWKYGPFELVDKLGVDWFIKKLEQDDLDIPPILTAAKGRNLFTSTDQQKQYLCLSGEYKDIPQAAGILLLSHIKSSQKPLFKNASASLWDISDGVICLEFHSKMNALDPAIFSAIDNAINIVRTGRRKRLPQP